ncbi:MAG: hypothetical protein IT427_07240 [Pirellulales bacterium]|nr:hypothetical protein [Pirellulales bacterium]
MSFDSYSPCPGGTGKKIKFCCPDLVQELDKVARLLAGGQSAACLDYLRKLDEQYPNRSCLQANRCTLESMIGDTEAAKSSVESFLAAEPGNAIALALKAIQLAPEDPLVAVQWLQKSLDAASLELPAQVYEAARVVALELLAKGHYVPARAHVQFQVGVTEGKEDNATAMLLQLERAPAVPTILKEPPRLSEPPSGVPWQAEFQAGIDAAKRGRWQLANTLWTALSSKLADSPELWRNLAAMRSNLGDYQGAADALRKFASLNVALDDAIDAEALAQTLTKEDAYGQVDELRVIVSIGNAEAAQEKFAADRRIERCALDASEWGEEDGPPPRAGYFLLDRELPATGVGLTRETVPHHLAQLLLFGKQTDREARLELTAFRPELDVAQKILREVLGDLLGPAEAEEKIGHLTQVEHALSWHWRMPDDTPDELRRSLVAEERRAIVLEKWLKIPQPMLGGRSPEQAASESRYRLQLLASIYLLQSSDTDSSTETYNELRRKLGLPEQGDIDATGLDTNLIPLARLARLTPERLSDDQLQNAFNRSAITNNSLATRRLAPEVVRRPSLSVVESRLPAYRLLARMATDSDESLRLIAEARTLAEANKQSSAHWDLMELLVRAQRSEGDAVIRLIDHIRRQHGREPGVLQTLAQLLVELGLATPDGRLAIPSLRSVPPESSLVVPGNGDEPGKLWTPDAPEAAGEKKSALWIPD